MVLLAVCILGAVCWRGTEECYSGALPNLVVHPQWEAPTPSLCLEFSFLFPFILIPVLLAPLKSRAQNQGFSHEIGVHGS